VALLTRLSILTPSFNYAWCLEDALRGVAETREHLPEGWEVEHVVVDGASDDESPEILERWRPRLTLDLQPENAGIGGNLNRALSIATGDWISWLNADDFHLDRSLFDACEASIGDADIIYGDVALVDASGRFIRLMTEHPFSHWTLRWWGTFLPVGAVFLRRSLLDHLGGWREDFGLLLDWDLWLRAAESGALFRYVAAPLVAVRRHSGQESQQDRPGRLQEKARVRREHRLPSKPWMWRAAQRVAALSHGARKLASGGYSRARRAAELQGRSMRWFDDPDAQAAVNALYERAYERGRHRSSPSSRA
jgi:glycosyltransferase involved in cell wall biosynthesis